MQDALHLLQCYTKIAGYSVNWGTAASLHHPAASAVQHQCSMASNTLSKQRVRGCSADCQHGTYRCTFRTRPTKNCRPVLGSRSNTLLNPYRRLRSKHVACRVWSGSRSASHEPFELCWSPFKGSVVLALGFIAVRVESCTQRAVCAIPCHPEGGARVARLVHNQCICV